MRLSSLVLVALLAPLSRCPPQRAGAKTLTLQDAIDMAQQQGPAAQVARSTRDAARWRDDAFNARLLPQLFLHGQRGEPQPRHQSRHRSPTASTQFIGQSQNQSSFAARVQPGDSAHGRHGLGRLGGEPHRPVRRRRTTQVLPDVAGRRQPAAGSVQAAHDRVGRARAVARRVASPSAAISRRARTSPATRPTRSSTSTRSR